VVSILQDAVDSFGNNTKMKKDLSSFLELLRPKETGESGQEALSDVKGRCDDTTIVHESIRCGFENIATGYEKKKWMESSGAYAKAKTFPNSYYANMQHYYSLGYGSPLSSKDTQQIDKDIERTMLYDTLSMEARRLGNTTGNCRPANIQILRRVLVATSWHLEDVGYCQSMDIICAFLLQYMEEEDTFWMLVTIVEDIMPGYYTPTLHGVQVC